MLKEKHIDFTYDDSACEVLAEKAYGGNSGARDLRNLIRREVEDKIAQSMIDFKDGVLSAIHLSVEDGNLVVKAI